MNFATVGFGGGPPAIGPTLGENDLESFVEAGILDTWTGAYRVQPTKNVEVPSVGEVELNELGVDDGAGFVGAEHAMLKE